MRKLVLFLLPVAIGAVLVTSAFGFMAHNTVSAQFLGAGRNDVLGYNVQLLHVDYIIPPFNTIVHVQFQMDPAPNTVQVWFDGGSGTVYTNKGVSPKCHVSGDIVDCFVNESNVTTTAMHVAGAD